MDLTPLMKGQFPHSKISITIQKTKVLNKLKLRFGSTFPSELEREGIKKLVAVLRDEEEKRTGNKEQDGFMPLSLELDRKRRQAS
jgi:hypothetical protein